MHEKGNNSSTESATEYVAMLATRCIGEMRVRNHRSLSHPFYLNDATHGRRQQLRDLALSNNSLQELYRKEELLERSPTLPRTYQTMAGNDGNSPEKLTVNSTSIRRTEVDNQDNISLIAPLTSSYLPSSGRLKPSAGFSSREILPKAGTSRDIQNAALQLIKMASHSLRNTFCQQMVTQTQATVAHHQSQATVTLTSTDQNQKDKLTSLAPQNGVPTDGYPDASYSSAPPVTSYSDVDVY
ncbi:UDP-glucose iridoid glucosyltransferase-like [Dorcoceras hygrometricum]|uniref:UDP-glucose iridoid glucosyltransferase-like n=1 Tax=Dorcoceras hygrometricum TaxID=472368 RepID=A0A2Z7BCP3_9LAMI|nr:UDP-glucose iridoid glucosyltransferase-like [Dorcoceras hygrometricum]